MTPKSTSQYGFPLKPDPSHLILDDITPLKDPRKWITLFGLAFLFDVFLLLSLFFFFPCGKEVLMEREKKKNCCVVFQVSDSKRTG